MYKNLDKSKPYKFPIPPTYTYLGEDESGYYFIDGDNSNLQLEGFNIGGMFKRMFKVTKKSFRPKNIFGAIGSGVSNFMTFGAASAFAPKTFSANSKTMRQVGMGVTAAVGTVAGGAALYAIAPAVTGLIGTAVTKAGSLMGGASGLFKGVAGSLLQSFSGLTPQSQTAIAQSLTPQDMIYAQQHNGRFPDRIEEMINQARQESLNLMTAQRVRQDPAFEQTGVPSVYQGLIQEHEKKLEAQRESQTDQLITVGAVAGGALLLILLVKK